MATKLTLSIGPRRVPVELTARDDGGFTMRLDDVDHDVRLEPLDSGGLHRLTVDGVITETVLCHTAGGVSVALGPDTHTVSIYRPGTPGASGEGAIAEGEIPITSPMTGTVVELLVTEGDAVHRGDPLVVVVAMKMNNEIKAPAAGVVKAIRVKAGQAVEQGALMMVVDATQA